jgi:GrpB-like predicted nucleotidyltransferase (UPF0157 family)
LSLAAYDPSWPARFEEERRRLAGMLPGARIEHVGATAVPGLAARPVIDVMALVADLDGPIPVLVERGRYELLPDVDAAAVLAGRRRLARPSAAMRLFELVLVDVPESVEHAVRFRDALRADAALARAYEDLRRAGGAKEDFVRRALEA